MADCSPAELRAIQERAVRAQPIDHTEYAGGRRLGRTASGPWWHGSVVPHGEPDDLLAQVEHAEAVGVARAVADAGWTGVFAMAVLPEARGRGAGRALIRVLAEWAPAQGTPTMHLQVEADNEPASALYAKAGFTEALAYHCRSQR